MALIKCPECNHEISDQASSCPHCGFPISKKPSEVKDDNIKKSFTVAYRSGPGGIVGVVITVFVLSIIALIGSMFCFIYSGNEAAILVPAFTSLLIGLLFLFVSIADFSYFANNRKHMDKNCIEYDSKKDKLILCTIYGEIIEINVEDYIELRDNAFTDNMLYFTYRTKTGSSRKVKLGYCSNREQIRGNIERVRH